jgi:hypothetical protein
VNGESVDLCFAMSLARQGPAGVTGIVWVPVLSSRVNETTAAGKVKALTPSSTMPRPNQFAVVLTWSRRRFAERGAVNVGPERHVFLGSFDSSKVLNASFSASSLSLFSGLSNASAPSRMRMSWPQRSGESKKNGSRDKKNRGTFSPQDFVSNRTASLNSLEVFGFLKMELEIPFHIEFE